MADTALGHHRNGNCLHDLANPLGRCHAGHPALGANLRGNAFQRHDRGGAGFFSNDSLFGRSDVHDDAALQHLGQAGFQA